MSEVAEKKYIDSVKEKYLGKVEDLIAFMETYLDEVNREKVLEAFDLAYDSHKGIKRKSGDPYFDHCFEVTRILAEYEGDETAIICGLIHDVVEDTEITLEEIEARFGTKIKVIIDGLTKIGALAPKPKEIQQAHNVRKILMSMIEDLRVIQVKFADRIHNMRTLEFQSHASQRRISAETQTIYAPLAHRLGMGKVKDELEDLSFRYLFPDIYHSIKMKLEETAVERSEVIASIIEKIQTRFNAEGLEADFLGQVKSIPIIYGKMERRQKSFEEIYDTLSLRIIVENEKECWNVFHLVHNSMTFVPKRFKDYINSPKTKGYQSRHTGITHRGNLVEVLIRTKEMERVAKNGLAAYWIYKEDGKKYVDDKKFEEKLEWLQHLVHDPEGLENEKEFMEDLVHGLSGDEVSVYTPKGKLIKLPVDSTPVDFAFEIHTQVGMQCIGAKVNGKIVALATLLHNGDLVEILTANKQEPMLKWLDFVKSPKAKSHLKKWQKSTKFKDSVELGKKTLLKNAEEQSLDLKEVKWEEVLTKYGLNSYEHLLARVGDGRLGTEEVLRVLFPKRIPKIKNIFQRIISKERKSGIIVDGSANANIRIARCCLPIPGDKLISKLDAGEGFTIHRNNCKILNSVATKQILDAKWSNIDDSNKFEAGFYVIAKNRASLLAEICSAISDLGNNITETIMKTEGKLCVSVFTVEVKNSLDLQAIFKGIKNVKGINKVSRLDKEVKEYVKELKIE